MLHNYIKIHGPKEHKCTKFIHYLHLLYFFCMFRYHILHFQEKMLCSSLKTRYCCGVTKFGLYSSYIVNDEPSKTYLSRDTPTV